MKPVLIKVRQAWDREAEKRAKTYDLFSHECISVETYQRKVFFSVHAPEFEGRVYLEIDGTRLSPATGYPYPARDGAKFSWDKPSELKGRFGYSGDLTVTFEEPGGQRVSHSVRLQITPGHLDDAELTMLLDDLVYLLYFDWETSTTIDIWAAPESGIDNPKLITWKLICDHADALLLAIRQIAAHPHQILRQEHHETRFKVGHRLDTESMRWLAQRGRATEACSIIGDNVLLPCEVPSIDIPENRFVLFVLRQVVRLLETLGPAIDGEIGREENRKAQTIARNRNRHSRQEMVETENRIKQLSNLQEERRRLQTSFQKVSRLPFFQSLSLDEATFALPMGSLVLTQEPSYFRVFNFYHKLQAKAQVDWLSRAEGLSRRLTSVGTDRMSAVYETWAFVRVYHELKQMGFEQRNGRDLPDIILGDRLNPRLYSGESRWIEMSRRMGRMGNLTLRLYHEKGFWGGRQLPKDEAFAWRPDITIEIWKGKRKVLVFLDAKYKDFHKHDKEFNGLRYLGQELYGSGNGIAKYLRVPDAIASFILHPTTHPDFENYGAQIPCNQSVFSMSDVQPGKHELGYIPFRPANPSSFRKFIGMILVLKLGFDMYCWNCHSVDVQVGNVSNKRYCPDCGARWWLNHCSACKEHSLIIKGDEVPFQVQVSRGNYLCPNCGKAGRF